MRKIFLLLGFLFFIIGCTSPSDCVESTGKLIVKQFEVNDFDKITVYKGIALVLTQGPEFKVEVQTGENLMGGIQVKVVDGLLSLRDNTTCNFVREYGHTTVFVTAPTIIELTSKTEKTISSNGILTYRIIRLFSMDLSDGAGTGDFNLEINNSQTVIENNNVARYHISGKTDELLLNFYDGNGRFEGENFEAKNIIIFQRGSNDMIVKPIESITGKIVSTGNVILKNTPPEVDVKELYRGRVIYN